LSDGILLEHPREHCLRKKHEGTCALGELRSAHCLTRSRPPNWDVERAVGIDELLKRPVERGRIRGGHRLDLVKEAAKETHVRDVSTHGGKGVVAGAVTVGKGIVKEGVEAFWRGLHAQAATDKLETPHRERRAVGKRHVTRSKAVCDERDAPLVLGIAVVVRARLGCHVQEGVRVDLCGACRHMRDAAAGKARRDPGREGGQVCQREKTAVALTQRHPPTPAELSETQILEVPDDRVGQEPLEVVGLPAGGICPLGRGLRPHRRYTGAIHPRGAAAPSLVWENHAKVAKRLLDPAVALGREGSRARPAGTSLEKHDERQVTTHVLR
jgi:hypothetical protein